MPSAAIKGKTLQIKEPGDKYSTLHNRNLKKLASSKPAAHRAYRAIRDNAGKMKWIVK